MEQHSSQERTRARTASVSAAAAIIHSLTSASPSSSSPSTESPLLLDDSTTPTPATANPFHLHPWSTERAKVAAETEISPPISPKQHATLGSQSDDFLEPLQESNSSFNTAGHLLRYDNDTHHHHHPNSPYFHNHNDSQSTAAHTARRLSRTASLHVSNSNSNLLSTLEPVSTTILFSHSTGSSSAVSSTSSSLSSASANSSSTSLSSVSLPHQNKSSSLSFEPLETEEASRLFLIDTPPSSHATSPSSESYPTLKGQPATLLTKATTTSTTSTTTTKTTATFKKKITTTRAPYHCTSKSVSQIIREISDVVDGRDKTIKVVQYFAKVFLWLFLSDPKQYTVLATRLKALAKQFSTTRKVLRLGHFIDPMASVLTMAIALRSNLRKQGLRRTLDKAPSQKWGNTLRDRLGHLNTVLGFVQDISDDIYCLGVIGVLDRNFADKAEPWSNRLWMVGVTIDLHENLQTIWDVRKQIKALEAQMAIEGGQDAEYDKSHQAQHVKLTTKLHWLKVTTVKLGGDFLFCGYDNLHCSFSDGFQAVTGFISGLAGAYKYVGKIME
ncbi:Peroxisomal membrane protein PMP27 [Linnemannia schmuckeri]|uniref:Peroxisomal membrane protein PMP27 n=1 Tax=Linnemannia schmuckeri TaxID=64567 RepID=A0A9P5RYK5_9FUNG|nr:Peroxisomal membrane protein PMP27 [Linnemannia schmuckeri]